MNPSLSYLLLITHKYLYLYSLRLGYIRYDIYPSLPFLSHPPPHPPSTHILTPTHALTHTHTRAHRESVDEPSGGAEKGSGGSLG